MKRILHTWFLILVVFAAACSRQETPPPAEEDMLYRVECFYQMNPDSALRILDTLNVSVLSEKERAHYCLLKAKLADAFFLHGREMDSLLQEAEEYFVGNDEPYFEAMTLALKARFVKVTGKNCAEAQQCYQKALDAIGHCHSVDERLVNYSLTPTDEQNEIDRIKFSILNRMAMNFMSEKNWDEGVACMRQSLEYYQKTGRLKMVDVCLLPLGLAYLARRDYDSSLMCFRQVEKNSLELHDWPDYINVKNHLGGFYLKCYLDEHYQCEQGKESLLDAALKESLGALSVADTVYASDSRQVGQIPLTNYDQLAEIYLHLRQYGQAICYATKLLDIAPGQAEKMMANRFLFESYKGLHKNDSAIKYADDFMKLQQEVSLMDFENTKAFTKVNDEYEKQCHIVQLEMQHRLHRMRLLLAMALLAILLLALLFVFFRFRQRKELEQHKLHAERQRLLDKLGDMKAAAFDDFSVQARLLYDTYGSKSAATILAAFRKEYPQTEVKLSNAYPDLTDSELKTLLFSSFGFRMKEIADMLDIRENTVAKYRLSAKKKTSNSEIDAIIRPFLG